MAPAAPRRWPGVTSKQLEPLNRQLLALLLALPQPDEVHSYTRKAGFGRERPQAVREIEDPDRFAHVEPEHLSGAPEPIGFEHERHGFARLS